MDPTTDNIELMCVDDIAAALRITPSAVRRLFLLGQLPGRKVGKRWWCVRNAFEKWLEGDKKTRTAG